MERKTLSGVRYILILRRPNLFPSPLNLIGAGKKGFPGRPDPVGREQEVNPRRKTPTEPGKNVKAGGIDVNPARKNLRGGRIDLNGTKIKVSFPPPATGADPPAQKTRRPDLKTGKYPSQKRASELSSEH